MKKKVLLSSVLVIAICLCLIAGSTFALFTSEKELDVEITSGNVTIDASINNFELWSVTPDASGAVVDENGATYSYVDPETQGKAANEFLVGGTGTNSGELIELDRIVPGDKVSFTVDTTNTSDVVIWIRYTVKVVNPTILASGMVLSVNGTEYTGVASYTSAWTRLDAGAAYSPVAFELGLPVFAGNEYQGSDVKYIINVEAVQGNASVDTYTDPIIVATSNATVDPIAYTIDELQAFVNSAVDGDVINVGCDIAGDLVVTQIANRNITINGNGYEFAGTITVDGKSATIKSAGLTIKHLTFTDATYDACIRLGGSNATRYVCNVTVTGCTFAATDKVGVKSYTGGDYNISIVNCKAAANAHSLAQLKGVDGVIIDGCTVESARGANFNNSDNVVVKNSSFNVQKYAVRFGESANSIIENYAVINCTLESTCVEDAVIVLRAGAHDANLNLAGTTIVGTPDFLYE